MENKKKFFIKFLWYKLNLAVFENKIEVEDCGTFVKIEADLLDISGKYFDNKKMFDNWVEKNKEYLTHKTIKISLLDLILFINEK